MGIRATFNQSVQLAAIDVRLRFNLFECRSARVKFYRCAALGEDRAITGGQCTRIELGPGGKVCRRDLVAVLFHWIGSNTVCRLNLWVCSDGAATPPVRSKSKTAARANMGCVLANSRSMAKSVMDALASARTEVFNAGASGWRSN
jgi:hypothetical protein